MHIDDVQNSVSKPRAVALIQQARGECKWLYDPVAKLWFSPDELEEMYGRIIMYNGDSIPRLVLRDPVEAIEDGWKRISKMQNEIAELQKRWAAFTKQIVTKANGRYL